MRNEEFVLKLALVVLVLVFVFLLVSAVDAQVISVPGEVRMWVGCMVTIRTTSGLSLDCVVNKLEK